MIEKIDYNEHRKYFPKMNHLSDKVESIGDDMSHLCVNDGHERPYVGDFPPKDAYRQGIYD